MRPFLSVVKLVAGFVTPFPTGLTLILTPEGSYTHHSRVILKRGKGNRISGLRRIIAGESRSVEPVMGDPNLSKAPIDKRERLVRVGDDV